MAQLNSKAETFRTPSSQRSGPRRTSRQRQRSLELIAGKYRLVRLLAEGGMGWVWLARHEVLDRLVALKLAKPAPGGLSEEAVQEARTLARLSHPGIVQVYDCGYTERGEAFLVMEHLQGQVLSEALRDRGRFHARDAVLIMQPVLEALDHCHRVGFIHRDLKPSNIFLAQREDGRTCPVLLDFGIADQLVGRSHAQGLGTPGYMPPEQLRPGSPVDCRVDVWAACAVLYELVAGRPAFGGEDLEALVEATGRGHVRPLPQCGGSEPALFDVLRRGLSPEPAERHPSARELLMALQAWLAAEGSRGAPVTGRRRRRHIEWHQVR